MHTQVCVVGTVATDPKLTKSAGRAAFCSFRLACNERRYDSEKQEWIDSDTNWYTINSFRGLADHAVASFNKGDRVMVTGRLRVRDWTSGEKTGTSTVVEAEALGHDLRWGTTVFTKLSVVQSPDDGDPQPPATGEGTLAGPATTPSWPDPLTADAGAGAGFGALNGAGSDSDTDATHGEGGVTPAPEYSAA